MRRLVLSLTAFVFSLVFPGGAFAAPPAIDQAGADALKPRILQAMEAMTAAFSKSGIVMERAGDVMVEPAGTYYAVTSPAITLRLPDGITRTVGMVAINAIPTDDPDLYKVAVALPTPMLDKNETGATVGTLSIGRQMMNGIWNMQAAAFVELNASYEDVRLTGTDSGMALSIPSMTLAAKFSPQGDEWQGPIQAVLTNFSRRDRQGSYQIGTLRLQADVGGLKFGAPPRRNSAAGLTAAQTLLADLLTRYADAIDATVVAGNVSFQTKDPNGVVRDGAFTSGSLQASFTRLRSAASDATWNLGVDGLTSPDAVMQRFMPGHIALKGSARKLPVSDLARLTQGQSWTGVMGKAGSDVTVETLTLDAPAYGVDANGAFTADAASALGGTGNLHMAVRGLQELNTWLAGPNAPSAGGGKLIPPQVVAALALVQLTGKDTTDGKGRAVKEFDLKIAPDGKILLNGADMSALTKMTDRH